MVTKGVSHIAIGVRDMEKSDYREIARVGKRLDCVGYAQ